MNGAIEKQLKIIKFGISKTERILKDFEKKFGMSGDQFLNLYNNGRLGDKSDYIRWAGEIETHRRLKIEMNVLINVEIC